MSRLEIYALPRGVTTELLPLCTKHPRLPRRLDTRLQTGVPNISDLIGYEKSAIYDKFLASGDVLARSRLLYLSACNNSKMNHR